MPTYLRYTLLALTLALLSPTLSAQKDSDILFTVDNRDITVGEFKYIYGKTSSGEADYSRASVEEYLDLYERFKLKVARARAMGLDTVAALQQELAGYRRQLSDNYLIDKRVTDPLVEELYARQGQDVEIHHILFKVPAARGGQAPDTLAVYQRARDAMQSINAGNFSTQAMALSEDQFSKERGGRIGFVTAPFPRGLYNLETAMYNAPEGKVVGPVRTEAGYHIAMKSATRPARGEVEVAHLLVRVTDKVDDATARAKASAARQELADGKNWEQVVSTYSEDNATRSSGGYLGFFGINKYEPSFENAAFGLATDNAISDVIKTQAGYHVIKRISRRGRQPLNEVRPLLENKVKQDARFNLRKQRMIREVRSNAGVTENPTALNAFIAEQVDTVFFNLNWQPTSSVGDQALFRAGDYSVPLSDFAEYLKKNTRRRMSYGRISGGTVRGAVEALYADWLDDQTIAYADSRLEEDFTDFAALMREYREGILLFEATKIEVWDKASEDTIGLQSYFDRNRDKYQFDERVMVTEYTVNTAAGADAEAIKAFAAGKDLKATLAEYGTEMLRGTTDEYGPDDLGEMPGLMAKAGSTSSVVRDMKGGTATFYKVEGISAPRRKELNEARGYVIADYQDELERAWVEQLRQTYPVKLNKKVLNKMIRK